MTIPVVKETYHTQCVVVVCNRWWYQMPKEWDDMTIPVVKEKYVHNV